jgi:hypothetical protein
MKINEPPKETEIEKSILASMFLHADNRSEALEALTDKDFYHTSHQILFSKIKKLHEAGHPVGLDTVYAGLSDKEKEKLKSAAYLSSLMDETPPSIDLKYHIQILKDRRVKRRTIELINSIEKKCYSGNGDLSDILNDSQKILEELQNAESIKTCENDTCCISLDEFYREEIEEKPIAKGFIHEGDQTVLHAGGGVGKSLVSQDIAMTLGAQYNTLWGIFEIPKPRATLFIQSENSRKVMSNRTYLKCTGDPGYIAGLSAIFFIPSYGDIQTAGYIVDPAFRKKIVTHAKKTESEYEIKIDFVVFDPLISFHDADENDNSRMRTTLDSILQISNEIIATPLVLHHDNRAGDIRGAKSIWDWARNVIKLEDATYRGAKRIKFTHEKCNNAEMFEPFVLAMDEYLNFSAIEFTEIMPKGQRERCLKVKEALEFLGGSVDSKAELIHQYMELTGLESIPTIHKHIDKAVDNEFINRSYYKDGKMKKARFYIGVKPYHF